ncbi:MAG TPA: hypothetical protein PLD25_02750 [Chloroflexota bacterium]|nr:hypothetical protein [Chloroflexota bacterium]HUM71745.1 hypothetical protein [Chloroflexota bacterium]
MQDIVSWTIKEPLNKHGRFPILKLQETAVEKVPGSLSEQENLATN